jgi:RHS repeat-associated protein
VTTLFLVDDQNPTGYAQVVEELTSTGGPAAVTRVYVYGNDRISQDQFNGSVWIANFYGYDGHGNVRYLTDATGTVTDAYDYDAFGDLIDTEGVTPNIYLYAGEQFDGDLGLYFLRARYLNADTGRFWTMDPFEGVLSEPDTLHRYLFAAASPSVFIDPSGNLRLDEALGRIGVESQLRAAFEAGKAHVARYAGKKIGCELAKEAVIRGVYIIFLADKNKFYVGQSKDIKKRIAQWAAKESAHLVSAISVIPGMDKQRAAKFARELVEKLLLPNVWVIFEGFGRRFWIISIGHQTELQRSG